MTATSGDTGAVTVTSPTILTFTTGNWATAQTVTVRAVDDDNADDESVKVSHTATSSDTAYDNLVGDVVTVTVTDDEVAGVSAGSGPVGVFEGGADGSYTVVLDSEPSGTVTVTATSGDTGAVTVTSPTILTFTTGNWATAQTVTVRAVDDDNADDESVEVSHTAASSDTAYDNLVGDVVTVTVTDDEVAGVSAGSGPVGVFEGGADGSYTVVLDSEPSGTVTVTATSGDTGAVTVTPTILTFTTGNWATAQTVTVRAVDDDNADDESVKVSHTATSSDAAYDNLVGDVVTVTVTDDEVAGVSAGSGPVGVSEGGADGSYTVVLDSEPSGTVTVTAASGDTGAVTVTPTILTFTTGNWATAQTVTVRAVDDDNASAESVSVSHTAASSDAAYDNLVGDVVTVTVDDDEVAVVAVSFGSDTYTVSEGGSVGVSVGLGSAPASNMTIQVAAEGGGGAVSSDFRVGPTSLVFTPDDWDTAQTVAVTAVDDRVDDDGESVVLRFDSLPAGVSAGVPAAATVTIADNDTAGVTIVPDTSLLSSVGEGGTGTYTVVLASQPTDVVTVTPTSGDPDAVTVTSPTVLTFTTGDWETAQTVTVTAKEDTDANDETVEVSHAASSGDSAYDTLLVIDAVTVTVTDDDDAGVTVPSAPVNVSEGGTATYTVVLASQPTDVVTVTPTSGDPDAVTVSPMVLTFTTGDWETAQTVTVTAVEDTDANDEEVEVSHAASSTDSAYNTLLVIDAVTVTVTDDDDAGVTVSPEQVNVSEGGTGTYTVVLASQPTDVVTVTPMSGDPDAVTVSPTVLTFTTGDWETAQTVTVTAKEDTDANDEEVEVSHAASSTDSAYDTLLVIDVVTVTVTDDEDAGVTVTPDASLMSPVDEGGTATYTVVLASQPTDVVTVTPTSGDPDAVTVTPTVLTFTTGDWETAQTVTVTAKEDTDANDEEVEVSHTASSTDSAYNNLTVDKVTVTVTDDDEDAGVTVTPDAGLMSPVDEGGTATYTVVLASQPTDVVTVTPTSGDPDAVTVSPTVLTFTTGDWATAQTVTVTAKEDTDANDEEVEVSHAASSTDSAYNNLTVDKVTVTVTDDDEDAGVTVTPDAGLMSPVDEGGTATYTVVLASQPTDVVTVTPMSGDPDAVTVSPMVLTFTTGDWETAQTVTVTAVEDTDANDEEVEVSHAASSTDSAYDTLLVIDVVTVTVTDDEDAGVTVTPDASLMSPVDEGGTATYTVVLASQPTDVVTVTPTSGDPDAVTVTPTVLTFTTGDWETAQTVTVTAKEDTDANDEEVEVSHTASSTDSAYNNLTVDKVTVTVTDDDEDAGVTVTPDASLMSPVDEGGTATYTVVLASQPTDVVTVTPTSGDPDAVTVTPTVLTFTTGDWETAQTVTVTAKEDTDANDEEVDVSHTASSTDSAYNNLTVDKVTVTVTDDEDAGVTVTPDAGLMSPVDEGGTATYTVVLASQPTDVVTVTPTSGDPDAVTVTPTVLTFTTGDWETAQTVTVTAKEDTDANDEEVEVSHTASSTDSAYNNLTVDKVTVTVTDDEDAGVTVTPDAGLMSPVDEGGTGTYTVVLASQPTDVVTVTPTSGDPDAVTVSPTVLTFTTGDWATAQTVTVTAKEDTDANDEEVDVSHAADSTDSAYNTLVIDVVTVTVTDDDDAGVTVTPDASLMSPVDEGGTATYTVVLASQPTDVVTVTPTSGDPDAVTVTPTVLTFTTGDWETAQTVTVTAKEDTDANDEEVEVSHTASSTDSAYNNLTVDKVTVTVTDDDEDAGVTVTPDAGLMSPVDEGGTATYTVVLASQPTDVVTVTPTSGDPDAVTVSPTVLTFTTGDWATAQTVTVTAEQDTDANDEEVEVSHTASSTDSAYNNLTVDKVTVTVTDDDEDAGVTVPDRVLCRSNVSEGGTATYTVVLASQPTDVVTVTPTSGDPDAVTVTPTVLTFTTGNWATAQTVTVTAEQDTDANDEEVDVSHAASSADSAYNNLTVDKVTVTVTDRRRFPGGDGVRSVRARTRCRRAA